MIAATPPVAAQLVQADAAFRAAVAHWDDSTALPPAAIAAVAREQLIELRLAGDDRLYRVVIRQLPARLRRDVVDDVQAHRELTGIAPSKPGPPIRLGPALPLARLRLLYREGRRRSGVAWQLLAAINYVETDFGRLREPSASGALGPMQFMPATWQSYGRGNIRDPRDAILAAARYLRAAGRARRRARRAPSLQPVGRVRERRAPLRLAHPPRPARARGALRAPPDRPHRPRLPAV